MSRGKQYGAFLKCRELLPNLYEMLSEVNQYQLLLDLSGMKRKFIFD